MHHYNAVPFISLYIIWLPITAPSYGAHCISKSPLNDLDTVEHHYNAIIGSHDDV